MKKQEFIHKNKTRGFTIIEVVLVLAIAGLIFMMVFVALPALQSSQRDTQRRDDLARLQVAGIKAQANNKNQSPWRQKGTNHIIGNTNDITKFVKHYMDPRSEDYTPDLTIQVPATGCTDDFRSPSGQCYNLVVAADPGHDKDDEIYLYDVFKRDDSIKYLKDTMIVFPQTECSGNEDYIIYNGLWSSTSYLMYLENDSIACLN